MPVTPFFTDQSFDAETRRVLGVALELVCLALRTGDCDEDVRRSIAGQLIELASDGERNPDLLCERALERIRGRQLKPGAPSISGTNSGPAPQIERGH